jgi:hypothetical protein
MKLSGRGQRFVRFDDKERDYAAEERTTENQSLCEIQHQSFPGE